MTGQRSGPGNADVLDEPFGDGCRVIPSCGVNRARWSSLRGRQRTSYNQGLPSRRIRFRVAGDRRPLVMLFEELGGVLNDVLGVHG